MQGTRGTDRRAEIKDFLTSRRARVTPEEAGLPAGGGARRVAGLRREEVALLAGVSVDYYVRLERGGLAGASDTVLEALARTLRLDANEHAHLYDLARGGRDRSAPGSAPSRRAPVSATGEDPVPESVRDVLAAIALPAVVMNRRLDLVAANASGRALYTEAFAMGPATANLARFSFLHPRADGFYENIEYARDLSVAMLRSATGRAPGDRVLAQLIAELDTRSEDFARRWADHEVHEHASGRKVVHHPEVGRLDLAYEDFTVGADDDLSVTTYGPWQRDPATRDGLALLAAWAAEHLAEPADHGAAPSAPEQAAI